jgi:branched-chain amino acid transport system permease protein
MTRLSWPMRLLIAVAVIGAAAVVLAPTQRYMTPLGATFFFATSLAWVLPDGSLRRTMTALAPALVMVGFADTMWHCSKDILVDGAITGLMTSLLAVGIVVVYRANRIVNFAQAQMGALPANLALLLIVARGWNYYLGTFCGLLGAVVVGVLVEFLFLRRFFNSPRLIATVATIGVTQLLAFIGIFLPNWIGQTDTLILPSKLPWEFHLNTTTFTGNEVLVLIVVPLTLLALMSFFRYSVIGTALRASAESADRAGTLGIPVRRLQSVLWAIIGVLSFITMFLRIGTIGTSIGGSVLDPSVLLAALGAAVIGRMERLPTTVAAAVGLGVVSGAAANAWNNPSAEPVVIAVIIAIALLLQRRTTTTRLASAAMSTWQSTREVRPVPEELRHERPVIAARLTLIAIITAVVLAVPVFFPENRVQQFGTMLIYAMVGVSMVILTGWAGQISLGQMAFVGVAGTAAGWFVTNFSTPIIGGTVPAMIIGGIVGALFTVLIGLTTLRARGLTFAVMSLAFALIVQEYLINQGYSPFRHFLPQWFQNGNQIPRPPVLSIKDHNFINLNSDTRFYFMCIAVLAFVIFVARGLRNTRTGRVLIGVRDNERAAEAYSVSGRRTLILAFVISGFIAGMAGALYQLQQQSLEVTLYGPYAGLTLFTMVVVGGLGSIGGAIIGAVYVFGATYFLPPDYTLLATSVGMLLVLMILPGGIGAALGDARDGALRWYARRRNIRVPSLVADTRIVEPVPEPSLADTIVDGAFASEALAEVGE